MWGSGVGVRSGRGGGGTITGIPSSPFSPVDCAVKDKVVSTTVVPLSVSVHEVLKVVESEVLALMVMETGAVAVMVGVEAVMVVIGLVVVVVSVVVVFFEDIAEVCKLNGIS